jgi:hypothetical protein
MTKTLEANNRFLGEVIMSNHLRLRRGEGPGKCHLHKDLKNKEGEQLKSGNERLLFTHVHHSTIYSQ